MQQSLNYRTWELKVVIEGRPWMRSQWTLMTEDLKDKLEKVKKRGKEKRKEGEKKKESKDYLIWKYKIK